MKELPLMEDPPPYVPPPPEGPRKDIIVLPFRALPEWLAQACVDVRAHPLIGLFYGGAFWVMALLLGAVFKNRPEYTMSIASGCLLIGPFLAMGLYDVSRLRERGVKPSFAQSLTCWKSHIRSMGLLVLVLIILELLWGRASLVVFAVFFNTGMPSTSSAMQAIFNPENWEFVIAYAVVGGGFAILVFSMAVVSIPMILDRDTDAISAVITSLEVVFHNTGLMLLWGVVIAALVGLSLLLPWAVGLVVVGPLLGHASWYVYRSTVRWPEVVQSAQH